MDERLEKEQGQVLKAMCELDDAIVLLIHHIQDLSSRVQCVCRPEEPVGPYNEDKTVKEVPMVPMVQSLNVITARVKDAAYSMAEVLMRLEL